MSQAAVVLVHGLWMNRYIMAFVGMAMRRAGHVPISLSYASVRRSLDDNARAVIRTIARIDAARVHIVAHSYGGIVALHALAAARDPRVRRVVLLGAPVAGSAIGASLVERPGWQPFLGHTASVWRDGPRVAIPAGVEVGAIAGTRPLGLGRIVTRFPEPNDGVVRVAETRLPGLADHLELDVAHSTMLASPRVARYVENFLREGRFR